VDLTVTRDLTAATKGITDFTSAYNDLVTFDVGQQISGQPLAFNSTVRNILTSFKDALRTQVDAAGAYSRAPLVGVTLNRSGTIDVDTAKLSAAMGSSLSNLQKLFGATGIGGAMSTATQFAIRPIDGTITNSITSISDSNSRLTKRMNDASARVEQRRQVMIARFTAMELAMNRLQAQSSALTTSLTGLSK
jgi:flagellar hook-associated protein 2